MQSSEILKVLQTSPLFRGIPGQLIAQHAKPSHLRTLSAGETLLVAGQPNNLIYIILSGRLSIQAKESNIEPIAMLGEGECVGEMSILGEARVSAYAIAATDCKLIALDQHALWELIDSSHEAAHNMLRILTTRIRHTDQSLSENLEQHNGFSPATIVDELTGLYNRNWMHDKFNRLLHRSILNKEPCCLLMLEMDQFEEYADLYGQLGSDQALRDIAHTVLSCLRPDDQAGHYRKEQFAIFMPHTALPEACVAAERLKTAASNAMVVLPSGDALPSVGMSLGISQARPEDTLTNLIARADLALQQAREAGGNCVRSME
ncbi:MAG TPA: GGDEF domain-containing protein [Gallionella sp.]|nr:GGDEF domain-containing protein [Gallionella sp.]